MKIIRSSSLSLTLQPSFFVLALLMAIFLNAGVVESVLVIGILLAVFIVHELGHIVVAKIFARPCLTIISCVGGRSEILGFQLPPWKRVLVCSGGLFASYLVFIGLKLLIEKGQDSSELVQVCLSFLYNCNMDWFLINLIPLYPFDCGELIIDIAQDKFGRRGERVAAIFCAFVAFLCTLYLLQSESWLAVFVCLYSLNQSFLVYKHSRFTSREFSEERMFLHHLCQQWDRGDHEKILSALTHLAETSSELEVRQEALSSLSGFLERLDRPLEAYKVLESSHDELSLSALEHLQLEAYKTSHWMEGLEAGKQAFTKERTLAVAALCALLAARLGRDKEAVEWIIAAQNLGLNSLEKFLEASDFDGIRTSPVFTELVILAKGGKER